MKYFVVDKNQINNQKDLDAMEGMFDHHDKVYVKGHEAHFVSDREGDAELIEERHLKHIPKGALESNRTEFETFCV